MKMNTIEKLRDALRRLGPAIEVPADIRERAARPLQRMLEWSKG
jgi:quinolinate synthase